MVAQLPHDILFIIFSKLPAKCLMRFKCISKQWCSIISSDPCFADMQMNNRNSEDSRILLLVRRSCDCSVKHGEVVGGRVFVINLSRTEIEGRSRKSFYHLQGSCNGLLFFTMNFDDEEVVLYNPLTQQVSAYSCPKPLFPALSLDAKYGFGFDSLAGKYKILRFYSEIIEDDDSFYWINVAAEIFSLGGKGEPSREIKNFPRRVQGRMVYAGGALHCASVDEFSGSLVLFSLLLDKEEFISSSFPNLLCVDLVEIGGFLGIVDLSSRSNIEIWVQQELRGEWIKEYKIDVTAPGGLPDNSMAEVIGIWKNNELLLSPYPNSFVLYDRESDALKFIELPTMEYNAGAVVSHRDSLVSAPRVSLNNEDS